MRRIQSASSINMYKQCPRKYYYRYIEKLPDEPGIHAIRGNIVHSALEHFFRIDTSTISDYKTELPKKIEQLFDLFWIESKDKLKKLKMEVSELNEFYADSRAMIARWITNFMKGIDDHVPFAEAFENLKPECEAEFTSQKLGVRGFVDAIYNNGKMILDYKTSRKDIITPEYSLQAGIYAILVEEVRGIRPSMVIFDFLKGEKREILVEEGLLKNTMFEIEQIHASTETDEISDYPRKPSGLCKWCNARGSGQCPFYDTCQPHAD